MIEIIVNCNDDNLTISYNQIESLNLSRMPIIHPIRLIEVFENLFNEITDGHDPIGVTLIKIDEDTSTTVGEW